MKNTARKPARKPANRPTSAERAKMASAQGIDAADALMAVFGFRRVKKPTSEQMLKAMADAADEQRQAIDAMTKAEDWR